MSFKSKQRAKHGHLFGDDPLNATLVSASDDPLFAPTKTSQSSRTNSPVSSDPLSRSSRPASPLDSSSSTPITARRTTTTKTNGSIFGDIDVSKLGGTSSNGNGVYSSSKRVSNASLRSTTTLRSSRQFDEDEEDLFGGGRTARTRVLSKATSPTLSTNSTLSKKSPPSNTSPEPVAATIPSPRKATPSPPPPPPTVIKPPTPIIVAPPVEENKSIVEEKPSSSFFASASRFFKSSSNTHSKSSSSASSITSVNSSNVQKEETALPSPRQPPPPIPVQQQQQQQQQPPSTIQHQQPKHNIAPPSQPIDRKQKEEVQEEEEEEEEKEQVNHHVIEDEATRAFADDVMSFKPVTYQPNFDLNSPDLSMDSLRLDLPVKRLLPSASTPTTSQADVDDPWFDGTNILSSTHNANRVLPILGNIEPSVSSPLKQHKVSVQDIEPQKRTAFADLITSWNTGETNNNIYETVHKEDPEHFFSHVAEEQRDIGFAGITAEDEDDDGDEIGHRRALSTVDVWDTNEENPWN